MGSSSISMFLISMDFSSSKRGTSCGSTRDKILTMLWDLIFEIEDAAKRLKEGLLVTLSSGRINHVLVKLEVKQGYKYIFHPNYLDRNTFTI